MVLRGFFMPFGFNPPRLASVWKVTASVSEWRFVGSLALAATLLAVMRLM